MKFPHIAKYTLPLVALGALSAVVIAAEEKEEKVPLAKIPAPAAAALKKAAAGAEVSAAEIDEEDGKVKGYEAGFMVKGRKREVSVTAEGKVYAIEDEIALSDAPAAVKAAIEKQAGATKVTKVERVEEDGKVTFEAMIGENEVEFTKSGEVIKEDEKDGKKE